MHLLKLTLFSSCLLAAGAQPLVPRSNVEGPGGGVGGPGEAQRPKLLGKEPGYSKRYLADLKAEVDRLARRPRPQLKGPIVPPGWTVDEMIDAYERNDLHFTIANYEAYNYWRIWIYVCRETEVSSLPPWTTIAYPQPRARERPSGSPSRDDQRIRVRSQYWISSFCSG